MRLMTLEKKKCHKSLRSGRAIPFQVFVVKPTIKSTLRNFSYVYIAGLPLAKSPPPVTQARSPLIAT